MGTPISTSVAALLGVMLVDVQAHSGLARPKCRLVATMSTPAAIKAGSSVPLGVERYARQIEENQVSCQQRADRLGRPV